VVARTDLPLAERLAAASRVIEAEERVDPDDAARAALALLADAEETACWLALRAADAGWIDPDVRERLGAAIRAALEGAETDASRARLTACGALVGLRDDGLPARLTRTWPPPRFVRAVLEREIGRFTETAEAPVTSFVDAGAQSVRAALVRTLAGARLLDQATSDDPETMRGGLDGLVEPARAKEALPLLLHEAWLGARAWPAGRMPRARRAVLALGVIGDRRATPALGACLVSDDGWVRAAAATALGDTGDPAGAVPLVVHLRMLGDPLKSRDQWDWPGETGTTVPEADWRQIDYFNLDCLAADSLLRLGLARAAGYLIVEKLDVSRQPHRIRVFQDAVDALRRALPEARDLVTAYNVDAGLAQRDAAFRALARWWHRNRDRTDLLAVRFDESDAGFRRAARELAERLRGMDVRQFMITKPACELLGPAMTPVLLEVLETATAGPARVELAQALALTRDPRAIPALLALTEDRLAFVRAGAAKALGTFAAHAAVAARLRAMLADPSGGPRVAAMGALVGARPSAALRADVERHTGHGENSPDYKVAEVVVRLVQEGPSHWPVVRAGLEDERRFSRERWWDLLRRALDLPEWVHEANRAPDDPHARRISETEVMAALKARRGG
jgi:HEAT repeat protein